MDVKYIKIGKLKPYKKNAKKHDKKQVERIAESIKEFGFTQPVLIDENNVVVAGHGRILGAKKAGLEEVPVLYLSDLTEEQIKAYRLVDNKLNESPWDFGLFGQEISDIMNIDMKIFGFENNIKLKHDKGGLLSDDYIIPPYSIIDTKQEYFKAREKFWKDKFDGCFEMLDGREGVDSRSYIDRKDVSNSIASLFSPTVAEICYKWFNIPGGIVYDCFSGGCVRGFVCGACGYKYVGIDLNEKQIKVNNNLLLKYKSLFKYKPKYINDDSINVDKWLKDGTVDMVFTCPPYFDLEIYSNKKNDLSNMTWENFKICYKEIIGKSMKKLKENRFAVFVVGDIRDKKGFYRDFVGYTINCFEQFGGMLYNNIIMLDSLLSSVLRARR